VRGVITNQKVFSHKETERGRDQQERHGSRKGGWIEGLKKSLKKSVSLRGRKGKKYKSYNKTG